MVEAHPRRGFLATVETTLELWQQHGPAIVQAHPVERVAISDKLASGHTTGLFSFRSDAAEGAIPTWNEVVPAVLFDPGQTGEYFRSQAVASEWLSARLIAWAKSRSADAAGASA